LIGLASERENQLKLP